MACAASACGLLSDEGSEKRSVDESAPRGESPTPAAIPAVTPAEATEATATPTRDVDDAYRALNRHFQEQATRCVRAMHARAPHAQGLLALRFRLVANGQGLAVDDVEELPQGELEDPAVVDCIAEAPIAIAPAGTPREFDLTKLVEPRGH
jgi:hypothetical protein